MKGPAIFAIVTSGVLAATALGYGVGAQQATPRQQPGAAITL